MESIELTSNAATQIKKILSTEAEGSMLRVSVEGGGCSGFQYNFTIDNNKALEDDLSLQRDGVTVLIDALSQTYLAGSKIDWVDDLIGSSFQINNPNASSSCGCGTSFSI